MAKQYSEPFPMSIDIEKGYIAKFDTAKGNVTVQLDPKIAPNTVNNFVSLARDGYYDGLNFHRVESWVVQGGCPTGTGTGGPGYKFKDEPVVGEYEVGIIAMANSGPNTNGSQFFFLTQDMQGRLAKSYNLFGRIIEGYDVVKGMKKGDKINSITIVESE